MSKKVKFLLIICIIIWNIFFITDVILAKIYFKRPIFSICYAAYLDGGTESFLGFGYKIILFKKWEDLGIINGIHCYGASYAYVGTWFATYNNAWEKVKDVAIEIAKKNIMEEYESNSHLIKDN